MFVKYSQPHASHTQVWPRVTRRTGCGRQPLWPQREPGQLECEENGAQGPQPSVRARLRGCGKTSGIVQGGRRPAETGSSARTLCITRCRPGRPGRRRRLREEQPVSEESPSLPATAPPRRWHPEESRVSRRITKVPGPVVPLVQQMRHPGSCCYKTSRLDGGRPPRPAWCVCGPRVRQDADAWRRAWGGRVGGRKEREEEGFCQEPWTAGSHPAPLSCLPLGRGARLPLPLRTPPTEAWRDACLAALRPQREGLEEKKNQLGRKGHLFNITH